MKVELRQIESDADYAWALAEIEQYFDREPLPGTADAVRFDALAALIEVYENRHHPVGDIDPIALIEGYMENHGLRVRDLAEVLSSQPRASEVLRRKRALTTRMIHALSEQWDLPADILVKPYALDNTA